MKSMVLAGALALAMTGSTLFTAASAQPLLPVAAKASVSEAQIGRLKAMLKLTAEQEPHWPAVEAALRQVRASTFDTAALKRLMAAARPLMKTLDESQKRTAMQLAHSLGLSSVAAVAF